ncbi:uncharacterized protein F4807DRAFT_467068 [Annulohypoxylon truncatum]|uniref:uncharacterized protein n=1 Tax=Annulohypoxylon truncatum TaxID=327061 RepID=UPI002007363C|nr:uncharacterized protein F4807DRAFT_467068 [Annulohypoxylon truncatum]KAI1210804.1 hypothetical protein F4807DRAFT_467068 [Annulohypoxylon truncatum]
MWGEYRWKTSYDICPSKPILEVDEPVPLDIVSLARVSRRVYHELEAYPVFYRVNTFGFEFVEHLHVFLAAITPKRRAAIRRLEVSIYGTHADRDLHRDPHCDPWCSYRRIWDPNRLSQLPSFHPKPFFLSLLSQCRDIREFRVQLKHITGPEYLKVLATLPLDAASPWNLPFIRVGSYLRSQTFFVFGETPTIPTLALEHMWSIKLSDAQLNSPEFAEHIHWSKQFHLAMATRRRRAQEEGNRFPKWFTDLGGRQPLDEAIGAAGLDFSGEDRVSQDRANSTVGPISSRTRRKKWTIHSPTGVLNYQQPKYSADGMLVIWNYRVTEVRWNDSHEIECKLKYSEPDRVPATSWENVESVVRTSAGEHTLCVFYDQTHWAAIKTMYCNRDLNCSQLLGTPSPNDVFELVGDINKVLSEVYKDHEQRSERKKRLEEWRQVTDKWMTTIGQIKGE